MKALATIAALLRERIGLDPDSLGPQGLAHAVRARLTARGIDGPANYLALLADDQTEWEALLEAVVVPETWFFRDREPFRLLARVAAHQWTQRTPSDPVTVLSLPCATGEEAWSIAIVLAAAGVPAEAFRVDAVDLSARALAIARTGMYRRRALRGQTLDQSWARYLGARTDGRLEVAAELRPSVHFACANVVAASQLLAGKQFDCIFSRNLLIYCDAATRAAALATFTRALRADGILFLGHAETLAGATDGFVREGPPGAFAWRRTDATPPRARSLVDRTARCRAPGRARSPRRRPVNSSKARDGVSLPSIDDVARARTLADRGKLAEAAALAVARLEAVPVDAPAHALLGIVRAAQGRDDEAGQHLRRALYLDPTHEEALIHLALVLERRGERAAAARLRDRARRLEEAR